MFEVSENATDPVGRRLYRLDDHCLADTTLNVLLDQSGGLLVADDVGNRIWRVTLD